MTATVAYCLWFRPDRRSRWVLVATGGSYGEALDRIATSGRARGDWIVKALGEDPNSNAPSGPGLFDD